MRPGNPLSRRAYSAATRRTFPLVDGPRSKPSEAATAACVMRPSRTFRPAARCGSSIERRHALVGELDHEGQRRVVERLRRGHGHRARHVRHAVMDDAVDLEGRIGMRRRPRGLEAAALVDRHVDQHGTALHVASMSRRDELRRAGAGDQHRADHHVGASTSVSMLSMVEASVRTRPSNSSSS